jgi:oligopeptide transport system substrate-binding protein
MIHKHRCWLIAVSLLVLAGCGDNTPEADFTYISGEAHNTLDPQRMSWMHDIRLADQLFEPLVYYDFQTGEVQPATATEWEVTDDGRQYTFHLREEARWSNGDPVTAQDYIYGWRRAMLPDLASDYTKLMFRIEGAEAFYEWRADQLAEFGQASENEGAGPATEAERLWDEAREQFRQQVGLEAVDEKTLRVTLASPTPYFLELVAFTTFAPVHRESVEAATTLNHDTGQLQMAGGYWTDPDRLVTNGPYRLAQRQFKQYALLEAHQHYWNHQNVRSQRVLERIIGDAQNALLTYENGGADWYPDLPTASPIAADVLQQNRDDLHAQPMAGTYFYTFNCRQTLPDGGENPLTAPEVRRAFAMAIDRQQIVDRVTQLNQPIARSYIPVDALPDYEPPVEAGVTFDPERARSLLAEAGHENGQGLDGLTILYNTGSGHEKIAQAVQQMWQQHLNVNVSLEGVQGKTFADRLSNGQFAIARASWFGDYPDPTTWLDKLTSDDGNNDGGWSDEKYDAFIEQAAQQTGKARRQTLRGAEARLLRKQPLALIFQYKSLFFYRPDQVSGLEPTGWHRWQLEKVNVE